MTNRHQWRSWLFALAAPAMMVVGVVGALQRPGVERLQALPMVLIGGGLTLAAGLQWVAHRRHLLRALQQQHGGRVETSVPLQHRARPGDTAE